MTIEKATLILCVVLPFFAACNRQKDRAKSNAEPDVQEPPFSISVVPQSSHEAPWGSSIDMALAHRDPRLFFVVITNVSRRTQAVWEDWNSWGYQTISFEITEKDGRHFVVSRRQHDFTVNFPSTFLIEPGEHGVYAIQFDERWEAHPSLPKADGTSITLKAIYDVAPTPEAAQRHVWTGHIESRSYNLSLNQW